MELSQAEKMLLGLLKNSRAGQGKTILVLCLLEAMTPQLVMCNWLLDNPGATEEAIVEQAYSLAEAYDRWVKEK